MNGPTGAPRGATRLTRRVLVVGLVIAGTAALLAGLVALLPYFLRPATIEPGLAQRVELACARVVASRARIPSPPIDATDYP